MNKYYSYNGCEIKYNPKNDEFSAFDEDGEDGGIYLGGDCGADGEQKAKKAIDDYLEWKNSFVDTVSAHYEYLEKYGVCS